MYYYCSTTVKQHNQFEDAFPWLPKQGSYSYIVMLVYIALLVVLFLHGAYFVVLFSSNVDRVDVDQGIGRYFARHKTGRNSP